jgi:hypothetical protein
MLAGSFDRHPMTVVLSSQLEAQRAEPRPRTRYNPQNLLGGPEGTRTPDHVHAICSRASAYAGYQYRVTNTRSPVPNCRGPTKRFQPRDAPSVSAIADARAPMSRPRDSRGCIRSSARLVHRPDPADFGLTTQMCHHGVHHWGRDQRSPGGVEEDVLGGPTGLRSHGVQIDHTVGYAAPRHGIAVERVS